MSQGLHLVPSPAAVPGTHLGNHRLNFIKPEQKRMLNLGENLGLGGAPTGNEKREESP